MNILVTGGAGYIGSHTVKQLVDAGHQVVVLDNFYSGHRWAVDPAATLVEGDIADQALLDEVLTRHQIDSVVHFAGYIVVPESVAEPFKYYENNVVGSLRLIESCVKNAVKQFVFSSSAAVYGLPETERVNENTRVAPINPYGHTKLITEMNLNDVALGWKDKDTPFRFVALRYFNAAGAQVAGNLGQATPEATHLIKVACETALGQRDKMMIFGTDYDTADGSCVRDYIHIDDLAGAHLNALDYLADGGDSVRLNCGYGQGYSVKEVVNMVKKVSGVDFTALETERRAGDPPSLIADNKRIKSLLNWQPRHDDLELICQTAFGWEQTWQARQAS
jgi:UDP-glucose 4-epimerase